MKIKLFCLLVFCSTFSFAQQWQKTGGPIGGLGYNIKIHPNNSQIMYITDAFSGVHKSIDGGENWIQKNNGITTRTGYSNDAIPVFVLGLDQNNPETIWAGTQFDSGIYKSTDGAENWVRKTNGIIEDNLVFREISVLNGDSNTVFASGEFPTGNQGAEFEKVKGIIYKTTDGGENWTKIWEGDSLARWLCINGDNTDIITTSTGIFDREANNANGVGIIKTLDGGQNWVQSNTGITGSLFIGGMSDAANSPNTIYIASGNNADVLQGTFGGIFKSTDFGDTWTQVLSSSDQLIPGFRETSFNAVKMAPSNNDIVYAASSFAFYKSTDAGVNWTILTGGGTIFNPKPWGPPGISGGFPIEVVIDKTNPDILFAANYGGGVFKSTDGAQTWNILGTGYTGAIVYKIAVDNQNSNAFLTVGRSGPFKTTNNGMNYEGILYGEAVEDGQWYSVAVHPTNSNTMFLTGEHQGMIFKSTDGGTNWTKKFTHPNANVGEIDKRHGAKEIVISKSNPSVMYAGYAYQSFYNTLESPVSINSFGVYKSIDGGENWTKSNMPSGTNGNITAMAVSSTNENSIYIGLRGDGIYHSSDGGNSWTNIGTSLTDQFIYSIELAENNSVIYLGTKSNGVYKSSDNGANWQQILDGSNEKMITTVKVNPSNQNHIVASDMLNGIYMSEDGGQNWILTNSGLSNRSVTTLAFSSDGNKLYAGTLGQGVFVYDTSALSVQNQLNDVVKNLFPNPTKEKITLNLQPLISKQVEVQIFNTLGKQLFKEKIKAKGTSIEINTSFLSNGIYILQLSTKKGSVRAKFIKE